MKVHLELIGTIPAVECLRNMLDEIILRYENAVPSNIEFGLMSDSEVKKYLGRILDGIAIELCAAHFYGLSMQDYSSLDELIDVLNGIENELRTQ